MSDGKSYRELLQELAIKSQEQYDKTLITLSTGALGLSFAFIKDIVDIKSAAYADFLLGSWICFIISILSILLSFLTSKHALEQAIMAEDNGKIFDNKLDKVTTTLNWLSASFFVVGLIFLVIFVKLNLGVTQ